MLDDIRKPESERREWIVEALKDENGTYTGYLHKGELVRCKECKHREEYPCKVYHDGDWFCADGERKEGE